jgi:hypothetical protein
MEKKVHHRDWKKWNTWRWQFLRISDRYQRKYKAHVRKPFQHLFAECLFSFNLVLTEEFSKKNAMPDPSKTMKQIESRSGPFYFYDYVYEFEQKSLMMPMVFGKGKNKTCMDVTKEDPQVLSKCREWQAIKGLTIGGKEKSGVRSFPGISLFAVDLNIPVEILKEHFEKEALRLKRRFRKVSTENSNLGRYYLHEKQRENARFEDFAKYWWAYKCSIEASTRDEAFQNFTKVYSKLSPKKVTSRNFAAWQANGEDLVIGASQGFFPYPD